MDEEDHIAVIEGNETAVTVNALTKVSADDLDTNNVLSAVVDTENLPAGVSFAAGVFSFDPTDSAYDALAEGETDLVSVTYDVTDGEGGTVEATITFEVTGTNDSPVGQTDTFIVGKALVGQDLSVDYSAVSDADGIGAVTVTWNLTPIDPDLGEAFDVIGNSYRVMPEDVGYTITASISYDDGGTLETVYINGSQIAEYSHVTVNSTDVHIGLEENQLVLVDAQNGSYEYTLQLSDLGYKNGVNTATFTVEDDLIFEKITVSGDLGEESELREAVTSFTAAQVASGAIRITGLAQEDTAIVLDELQADYPVGINTIIGAPLSDQTPSSASEVIVKDWNLSNWTVQARDDQENGPGYSFVNTSEDDVVLNFASGVEHVKFEQGGEVRLHAYDEDTPRVEIINGNGLTVTPDALSSVEIEVSGQNTVDITITGADDSTIGIDEITPIDNFREDVAVLSFDYSADAISTTNDGRIVVSHNGQDISLSDVEAIQFSSGETIRIVGGAGYDSVEIATGTINTEHLAQSGDHLFISNTVATDNNDVTINRGGLTVNVENRQDPLVIRMGEANTDITLEGSAGVEVYGTNGINVIRANGNDVIFSGDGADEIELSGAGNGVEDLTAEDVLTINAGATSLTVEWDGFEGATASIDNYAMSDTAVTINANGYDLDLSMTMGSGFVVNTRSVSGNIVTITDSHSADLIYGDAGNDEINVSGGDDVIDGGSGIDQVRFVTSFNFTSTGLALLKDAAGFVESYFSYSADTDAVVINTSDINNGIDYLRNVEQVTITGDDFTQNVLIVGAGGYANLALAHQAAASGDIIYVADHTKITSSSLGAIAGDTGVGLLIESGSGTSVINFSQAANISVFGGHAFTINGSSQVDTIRDFTHITAGLNTINGNAGDDRILVDNASGIAYVNGGAGNDTIVGGANDQLSGGDGRDNLLALFGPAYLSGGAGDDLLVNSYLGASSNVDFTNMVGGTGNDRFLLAGNNDLVTSGYLKTSITDLSTGDLMDLRFLENSADNSLSTSDLGGTASIVGSSIKVDLGLSDKEFTLSTSSGGDDTQVDLLLGSQVLASNTTTSKLSSAITAGQNSAQVNLDTIFGSLTDVYQQT